MAKFLEGSELNAEIIKLFNSCREELIIISPYLKFHPRIKDALQDLKDSPKVKIDIVFGKNEKDISKSFRKEDFELVREFPNIEIHYEPRLHAKYYANENSAVLSSMNLYDYSQNSNLEFGILMKSNIVGNLINDLTGVSIDYDSYKYFDKIRKKAKTIYKRVPHFKGGLAGFGQSYSHSETECDNLSKVYSNSTLPNATISNNKEGKFTGYCIRTGKPIPFNPEKPLSDSDFRQWYRYKDKTYSEKYCHFSGEESQGKTSFEKPILRKNWKQAKAYMA